MSITLEDLAAFVAAEAEIRALPTVDGASIIGASIERTPEYQIAKLTAAKEKGFEDCENPVIIFRTCRGEEKRCGRCSETMTKRRISSILTGELCPFGCGQKIVMCWTLVGEVQS